MTEENKPYFGCIPKDQVLTSIENFKKALAESSKEGESKMIGFSIKGTKEDPKGFASETYSFKEDKYNEYFDMSAEHLKEALTIVTFQIHVDKEEQAALLKELFDKFLPMTEGIPYFQKRKDEISINFRAKGTKVNIDIAAKNGKFLKPIMELGVNAFDFGSFRCGFKTEFVPADFFNLKLEELAGKLLQFVLDFKVEGKDLKYLLSAAIKTLKEVKLTNDKYQKKLEKLITYAVLVNAFVKTNTEIEFNPKEIVNSIFNVGKEALDGQDPNDSLSTFKTMAEGAGGQFIKPTLEGMQLLEPAKAINIDEIVIAFGITKDKAGIAHSIKLPGLSQLVKDKFLS